MESSSASASTTILDMNDDCLNLVFKYLGLRDLSTVADVCSRISDKMQKRISHVSSSRIHLISSDSSLEENTCFWRLFFQSPA